MKIYNDNLDSHHRELVDDVVVILIPVFNDWKALNLLLLALDKTLRAKDLKVEVLIVDDASIISLEKDLEELSLKSIKKVNILELRRNLGHQRAITIGLAYVEENIPCRVVAVMDGDGEDTPEDVLRMLERCKKYNYKKLIFAQRTKRSESWKFRFFYSIYRQLYRILTGQVIRFGNFSVVPRRIIGRLVVVSEIWNHYAVGIMKARIPHVEVPCQRGNRLAGNSTMNFVSLVTHGLSAISVYGETVGVRLLVVSLILICLIVIFMLAVVLIRLATPMAIPGWASYMFILLGIVCMEFILLSTFFIFTILSGRNASSFIPKRDYQYFVLSVQQVFPKS
ncbi:MAG: glycosyltransferase [Cyanothece sp. SIO1E1]|nr:glycosyltransferase [Cyanothece sp. SIO1E1]